MTPDTLLLRQIHPSFVQNGRPTSQAFLPTAKDGDQLSVYDGDMILPLASWEHYTTVLGLQSAGVMAVTFAECGTVALSVIADGVPFPEHCTIDFSNVTPKEAKKKAKVLASFGDSRGWLLEKFQQG